MGFPFFLCGSLSRNGHLGKQHSSVTLERRCQSALHLTIPEPAPIPLYSDTFRRAVSRFKTIGFLRE